MLTVEEVREWIISKLLKEPKLGENYADWHTKNGECGLTIKVCSQIFDITINHSNHKL